MFDSIKQFVKSYVPEIIWNPIYICENPLRRIIKNSINELKINQNARWLDVGCGLRPYEHHFPKGCYIGVDVETSGAEDGMKMPDYFYDGRVLPFSDARFDGIISTQVLEHVVDVDALVSEMSRVVKPEGRILLSLPFAWQEHEEPYDFLRFSTFGIANCLERVGLEVVSAKKDTSTIESLAVLLNIYIINNLVPRVRGFGVFGSIFVCFPIQILALILSFLLPDEGKFYLNLVVMAKKRAA